MRRMAFMPSGTILILVRSTKRKRWLTSTMYSTSSSGISSFFERNRIVNPDRLLLANSFATRNAARLIPSIAASKLAACRIKSPRFR